MLLAENTPVALDRLREMLRPDIGSLADDLTSNTLLALEVDWDNFRDDYPAIRGDVQAWLRRLAEALADQAIPAVH
ncbi:hypothetical protein [Pseudofrankia asymbiotica]|uniref:Uncharacterized protein n=1 Tax=Pseudofrankia asymbiotica TaxID=1834516 RepID=A0A1V2I8S4_9ACTN|nr:hypothetical protein [Pseudofrankia asymbiotica]ONH28649.1 hypothetical protein BL253_18870 [Pseudofrankia asymbiotica]